ncbi:MAG TPA: dTDP-4-dehydrorhamnose reductase [Rhodocyclaceae bacterium]|nr:dTDP-4-dehydrorhamnose reductase [Rhodocyclaceae bacterium]
MTRILLIGTNGQVGWELARSLLPLGEIVAADRMRCDLAQAGQAAALVAAVKPGIIVNAAAYTAVDQAENEPGLAMRINAEAPAELARAAHETGALLVHYSSDYVFDGKKKTPYLEEDRTAPSNVYGQSKLAGESAITSSGADYVIFRTSWVYSARGKNFLRTIMRLADDRESLRVVGDQIGAPTWARLIAETTAHALCKDIDCRLNGNFTSALLHLSAAGSTSWHGFASAIIRQAQHKGHMLKCREVSAITSAEYPLPAQRPANSRLSCNKLQQRYGLHLPDWEDCLSLVIDELSDIATRSNG